MHIQYTNLQYYLLTRNLYCLRAGRNNDTNHGSIIKKDREYHQASMSNEVIEHRWTNLLCSAVWMINDYDLPTSYLS